MRPFSIFILLMAGFLFSGCTVVHLSYVRNLGEHPVELTFIFPQEAATVLPDSMYIPSSVSSHLVNKNTWSHMTDSVIAKKTGTTKMKITLPSGSMIMYDKATSKKIRYHDPSKMEVSIPATGTNYEVIFGSAAGDAKQFKSKGMGGRIHWFDVY